MSRTREAGSIILLGHDARSQLLEDFLSQEFELRSDLLKIRRTDPMEFLATDLD